MNADELEFIRRAAAFLEDPGVFIRTVNLLGRPVEAAQKRLPAVAQKVIGRVARFSIEKSLAVAIGTIEGGGGESGGSGGLDGSGSGAGSSFGAGTGSGSGSDTGTVAVNRVSAPDFSTARQASRGTARNHILATAATGAIGGAIGLIGLPLELPVTTVLMQRSIAKIAADFGADLDQAETRLECLYIFTLGTPSQADDATETAYYASRMGFAELIREAVTYLARGTAVRGTAPVLVRVLASVAARFEIAVTEKVLAGAIPLIGAAGGALINTAFTNFFNEAARYHFGLKHLEKLHGRENVQAAYRAAGSLTKKT